MIKQASNRPRIAIGLIATVGVMIVATAQWLNSDGVSSEVTNLTKLETLDCFGSPNFAALIHWKAEE